MNSCSYRRKIKGSRRRRESVSNTNKCFRARLVSQPSDEELFAEKSGHPSTPNVKDFILDMGEILLLRYFEIH